MSDQAFYAYYRVSTDKQGKSGLGLEAQKQSVLTYLNGQAHELRGEFVEVESGKRSDRPELQRALEVCKRAKATLVIAKLDRLARNVHFISGLMESNVPFVACDNPHANKLMVHMLAAFAEHERDMISKRTKEALAAAKARGVELGKNGKKLAIMHKKNADQFAIKIAAKVKALQVKHPSVRALTDALNKNKVPTPTGKQWHSASTHRLLKRIEGLAV